MLWVAYLGPETMLPVTSVLAGALGFLLMFGRKAVDLVNRLVRPKSVVVPPKTRARGHRPTTSRTTVASASSARSDVEPSETEDNPVV